jgi:hypothetical protein
MFVVGKIRVEWPSGKKCDETFRGSDEVTSRMMSRHDHMRFFRPDL